MIFIDRFRLTVFSLTFSQLIATLGFAPITRASSMMPLGNEYAIEFSPPVDRNILETTIAQNRCPLDLTPLIPQDTSKDYGDFLSPYFSLTVRPNPTFFFLFDPRKMEELWFELVEYNHEGSGKEGGLVYEISLNLSSIKFNGLGNRREGSIGISLPSDVTLEPGKTYHWYISAVVGRGANVEVRPGYSGWIERVEVSPTLRKQLARAQTSLDRARVYAEAGIWHDAFDILVRERRLTDTPELEAEWDELLESALGGSIPLPEFYEVSKCL